MLQHYVKKQNTKPYADNKIRMHRNRAGKKMALLQCVKPVRFGANFYIPFNVASFLQ